MYDETPKCSTGLAAYDVDRMPTAREQLDSKKKRLEAQLLDVNEAIKALDDHPDVEKVLTLVGRTVRF